MHAQFQELIDEFRAADERLARLAARVPDARWSERPRAERWSIGECVAHLILTADGYRTFIEPTLTAARAAAPVATRATEESDAREARDGGLASTGSCRR